MLSFALIATLTMLGISFGLVAICLLLRRSLADRVLALDTLYVNAVALIVASGILASNDGNFEAALLIAVLGFISTVALCRYMLRGDLIE